MYVHEDAKLNQFVDVKIPSAEELFLQFGYKVVSGHPDNVKGETFSTPSNLHGINSQDRLNMEMAYLNQEIESYRRATSPAVSAPEVSAPVESATKEEPSK